MDVDTIRDLTYSDTNTTSNQISTALIYQYMNIAYHDLVETIKDQVDPDFFYDYFTTSLVSGQNEYVLQAWDNSTVGIDKISTVGIKYDTDDTEFKLLRLDDPVNLTRSLEWYETNHSQSDPFYLIRDDSIFIYPTPDTAITDWLRIHGIYTPIDLVSGWAEDTLKIRRQYHEWIAMWARRNIYARRSQPEMETDSINKFNEFKQRMVKSLRDRMSEPLTSRIPNLTYTFE